MKITNLQKCIPKVTGILPGLVPVLLIGAAAWWFGNVIPILGDPVAAILIGLAAGEIFGHRPAWEGGLQFSSRTVLQASIVLLGAGMSLAEVARIGIEGLPVMAGNEYPAGL